MENKTQIVNLEKGKLPPQAIDLEEAVLGSILIDRNAMFEAVEIINENVFYKDNHKIIFQAANNLFKKNNPIDLLTVSSELKKISKLDEIGGDMYLIILSQKVSSSAHMEYWCRIILQKYIQRKCISVSSGIIEKSYDEDSDVFELLEKCYKDLGDISDFITVGKTSNFKDSVKNYFNTTDKNTKGIKSCLTLINKKLNGWKPSDLIITAARPGMGKTAYVLNEILECGLNDIPVAFFSLEMSEKQIIGRLISIMSGVDISKINNYNLTPDELARVQEYVTKLSLMPIYIDDTSGISPIELKIKCNKLKREKGIKMVIVDYLQLMKVKDKKVGNREQEISEISQSLKNLAKDLDVPVMALSQLSRSVEQRGSSKRPLLSDLRDSGSIEQDADVVMFIYRPEYYHIDEWDDEERSTTKGQAEIDIAKYRHGETGYCRVGCDLRYMRFMDLENVGYDLSAKYLQNKKIEPKSEYIIELPKPSLNQAFDLPKNTEEQDDIPF